MDCFAPYQYPTYQMNLLERINRVINDPLFEEVLESRGLTLETFRRRTEPIQT